VRPLTREEPGARQGPSRYDLSGDELAALLEGEPSYRLEQVRRALAAGLSPEEITVLPKCLRQRLAETPAMRPAFVVATESPTERGATVKWLLKATSDRARVEVVLMRYPARVTACVSSQAGCAMACSFCATGQMGFCRQLSSGEILEQVVRAARAARDKGWGRLSNVVFMGMGEPMANYGSVVSAVHRAHDDLSLAARAFTI
jgi:23S rRNA (adenine2503-C2)-methyltransferase